MTLDAFMQSEHVASPSQAESMLRHASAIAALAASLSVEERAPACCVGMPNIKAIVVATRNTPDDATTRRRSVAIMFLPLVTLAATAAQPAKN